MDQAAEILVIIVSCTLSIFLIVGIILGIYLIKLTSEIRNLAKTAKNTVSHLDSAVVGISHITSPVFVAKFVSKYINKVFKKGKK